MNDSPSKTVREVVTDFLGSAPSLEALAAYRLPDAIQEDVRDLLDKERAGSLSDEERSQLEAFREMQELLTLVQGKASGFVSGTRCGRITR